MSWSEFSFGELYAEPSRNGVYKPKDAHGQGTKIVNMGELFAYEFVGSQNMARLEMTERELVLSGLKEGDLLFGRRSLVEAGAGKCSIVTSLSEPTTFESSIIRVRLNQELCDPTFYYYWFKSRLGRGRIRSIVSGTNVKGIRSSDLRVLKVAYPGLLEQRRIVNIVKEYDDLIENNRRRIALLERAVRLLYREWFVHFRFPGRERTKVKDGTPDGWSKCFVGSVLELRYGKALKESDRRTGPFPVYGSSGIVGTHESALAEGPSIVIGRKGNVGSVYWVAANFWPIDTVYFVPKEQADYWLYLSLPSVGFQNTDGGVPGLNRDFAYSRKLVRPTDQIRKLFNETVDPLFFQRATLEKCNVKLAEGRDLLLPHLMNGEMVM